MRVEVTLPGNRPLAYEVDDQAKLGDTVEVPRRYFDMHDDPSPRGTITSLTTDWTGDVRRATLVRPAAP